MQAVVAMSSPVPLGQVPLSVAYNGVSLPCLHITGTADNSIVGTTQAYQRRLPFDHVSAADQYLITLNGADHMTYSGHIRAANGEYDAMFQRLIAESSAAFWDAYLKQSRSAKTWLAGNGARSPLGCGRPGGKEAGPVGSTANKIMETPIIRREVRRNHRYTRMNTDKTLFQSRGWLPFTECGIGKCRSATTVSTQV